MKIKQISISQGNQIFFTYQINDKQIEGNVSQNKIDTFNIKFNYIKGDYHKELNDWEEIVNVDFLIEQLEIIEKDHQDWLTDPQQFKLLIQELPNIQEDMKCRLFSLKQFPYMETREWKEDNISPSDQNLFDQIKEIENQVSRKIGDYQPNHWKLIYLVVTNIKINFKGQTIRLIKLGETIKTIEEYLKNLYSDYEKRINFKAYYAIRMFNYQENGSSVLDKLFHKELLNTVPQTKVYLQASSSKSRSKVTYRREFYYLTQEFVDQVRQILMSHVDEHYQRMKVAIAKTQQEPNLFTTDDSVLHQFVKQEEESVSQDQVEQFSQQQEKQQQGSKKQDSNKQQSQQQQQQSSQQHVKETKLKSVNKQFVESEIYQEQNNQINSQDLSNDTLKQSISKENDSLEQNQYDQSSKIEDTQQESQILKSEIIMINNQSKIEQNNFQDQDKDQEKENEQEDSILDQTIKIQDEKYYEQKRETQYQQVKPNIVKAESFILESELQVKEKKKVGSVISDRKEEQKQVLKISQQGYERVMQNYSKLKTRNNFILHNLLRAQVQLEQS